MDRIPILKLGDALLVTVQVDMHDQLALALEEDLTGRIAATGAKGVLIDISGLAIVDSFIGRMLGNIAAVSRMLDAETVVVGMRPAVAITLVELGLDLAGVRTALDIERGMALIRRRLDAEDHAGGPSARETPAREAPAREALAGEAQAGEARGPPGDLGGGAAK